LAKLEDLTRGARLSQEGRAYSPTCRRSDAGSKLCKDVTEYIQDDEAPDDDEVEVEEEVLDQATAARPRAELKAEIEILQSTRGLMLDDVRSTEGRPESSFNDSRSSTSSLMFDVHGHRRKLVVFTEHRDTLNYLLDRIGGLIGRPDAIVTIHGGMGREERCKSQECFTQDKTVEVLVATDAAGEGINLQRAHLMVNYDLPWNPNRLEQRFGRIHRIGQTEVCHLNAYGELN
jgi:superfamily II DNA/RNA helicase